MNIIEIKKLKRTFPIGEKEKLQVLKGIDLTLKSGELVSIIGESGSGKSTLLNIIGGLDSGYHGDVIFKGKSISKYKDKELDDYRKLNIGFIFQSFNLIPSMSVIENIMTTANLTDMNEDDKLKRAEEVAIKLGIKNLLNKMPNKLSGGQKQRVAIARALMNKPDVILADEPTGALDKENAENVTEILKSIAREGTLVIVVTHSSRVASLCDRVIKLEYGNIASDTYNKVNNDIPKKTSMALEPKRLTFGKALKNAYQNMKKNKTRNTLVSLGAGIGIFSLVILFFLSSGIQTYVTDSMYEGNNPLLIEINKEDTENSTFGTNEPFFDEEIEDITNIDGIEEIEKSVSMTQSSYLNENSITMLSTTNSNFNPPLKYGELPELNEIIISESVASILSDDMSSLIGTSVKLDVEYEYEIVSIDVVIAGIIENDSTALSRMKSVYTTYETLENNIDVMPTTMFLVAENEEVVETITSEVTSMGFVGSRQEASLGRIIDMLNIIETGLVGIASVSLIVSGIMILVVLFISVIERTKEIGTLRAMGASKSDIKNMFIAEGLLLGLFGGIIGSLLAILIGAVGNGILSRVMGTSLIEISFGYMLLGIVVSVLVSVVASFIPSSKASKLDPIDALRYE